MRPNGGRARYLREVGTMPQQTNPYVVFDKIEAELNIEIAIYKPAKERCQQIWEKLRERWYGPLTREKLKKALDRSRLLLK